MRLAKKAVVVTGGGTGIGRAIAERLAAEGASVALAARNRERLEEAATTIRARGARSAAFEVDVAERSSVERMARDVEAELGPVDILVNNAGVYPACPILETSEKTWRATLDTNLGGAFFAIQAFAPKMIERRFGRIINVTSPSAFLGFAGMGAYAATKGGLVALTRCAAAEFGAFGVTVNCVCPGATATEKFVADLGTAAVEGFAKVLPIPRIGEAGDCAGAVALLASDEGAYITGTTIVVDGGLLSTFPSVG